MTVARYDLILSLRIFSVSSDLHKLFHKCFVKLVEKLKFSKSRNKYEKASGLGINFSELQIWRWFLDAVSWALVICWLHYYILLACWIFIKMHDIVIRPTFLYFNLIKEFDARNLKTWFSPFPFCLNSTLLKFNCYDYDFNTCSSYKLWRPESTRCDFGDEGVNCHWVTFQPLKCITKSKFTWFDSTVILLFIICTADRCQNAFCMLSFCLWKM